MILLLLILALAYVLASQGLEKRRRAWKSQRTSEVRVHMVDQSREQDPPDPEHSRAEPDESHAAEPTGNVHRSFAPTGRTELSQMITELVGGDEWEKVIGGSWLNKAGVLIFVIGVGLLLHHSFGHLGAIGKIAAGLVIAILMITGGVFLEGNEAYPAYYGRELIGGGWAALYVTTYAAHNIATARIVEDPFLATILLLAVAIGMILHSLYYRSEVVAGLAYFVAFVTLTISATSEFAIIASLPLTISLLLVAHRFRWTGIVVFGLLSNYAALAVVYRGPVESDLITDQATLVIDWLMFEAFDLLNLARRDPESVQSNWSYALFPMNACGFISLSLLYWNDQTPVYLLFSAGALLFFTDTLMRAQLLTPISDSDGASSLPQMMRGYEASLVTSTLLAIAAATNRFSGLRLDPVLIAQAQLLVVAGRQLRLRLPRALGSLILIYPVLRLATIDLPTSTTSSYFLAQSWPVTAVLTAIVLYFNRWYLPDQWKIGFSYAATTLLVLVIDQEVNYGYRGLGWLTLGVFLLQAGVSTEAIDLRIQGYCTSAMGLIALLIPWIIAYPQAAILALGIGCALAYAVALETHSATPTLPEDERSLVHRLALMAGASLVLTLLWRLLPVGLVAAAWALFSLALSASGLRLKEFALRRQGYIVGVLASLRCWQIDFGLDGHYLGLPQGIVSAVVVIATLYATSIVHRRNRQMDEANRPLQRMFEWLDAYGDGFFATLALLLLTALLYNQVPPKALTEAWAMEGLPLLIAGFVWKDRLLRIAGLSVLTVCIIKLFIYDLSNLETLARIFSFMILGLLLLGASYLYARYYKRLQSGASRSAQ